MDTHSQQHRSYLVVGIALAEEGSTHISHRAGLDRRNVAAEKHESDGYRRELVYGLHSRLRESSEDYGLWMARSAERLLLVEFLFPSFICARAYVALSKCANMSTRVAIKASGIH